MFAIIKRNILIYFRKFSNIMFSLLGSMIFFFIYILFLRKNILSSLHQITAAGKVLDMWMLGALLTITAMTTALNVMGQLVTDKSNNKFLDFKISVASPFKLLLGYFGAAMLVSVGMQVLVFGIVWGYFLTYESLRLTTGMIIHLVTIGIESSFCATGIACLVCAFIKNETALRAVNTIFGSGFGFLIGGYFPIGEMSTTAQHVIKAFPLTYSVAQNRQILMDHLLKATIKPIRVPMEKFFGLNLTINGSQVSSEMITLILIGTGIILILLIAIISRKMIEVTMAERS